MNYHSCEIFSNRGREFLIKVNAVISGISTTNLEGTNKLVYAAAKFVCDSVGPRDNGSVTQCIPPWKV